MLVKNGNENGSFYFRHRLLFRRAGRLARGRWAMLRWLRCSGSPDPSGGAAGGEDWLNKRRVRLHAQMRGQGNVWWARARAASRSARRGEPRRSGPDPRFFSPRPESAWAKKAAVVATRAIAAAGQLEKRGGSIGGGPLGLAATNVAMFSGTAAVWTTGFHQSIGAFAPHGSMIRRDPRRALPPPPMRVAGSGLGEKRPVRNRVGRRPILPLRVGDREQLLGGKRGRSCGWTVLSHGTPGVEKKPWR